MRVLRIAPGSPDGRQPTPLRGMTMKKLFVISLFTLALALHLAAPPASAAQQLKLDIKVFLGVGGTAYVAMLESGRERDLFGSYQIGFGPRLRRGKAFIEALFSFNRWIYEGASPTLGGVKTQVNSFELPLLAGYIPYQNPYFKFFLYGGYVNHFNTKIIVQREGQPSLRLKPKADNLIQNRLPPGTAQPRLRLLESPTPPSPRVVRPPAARPWPLSNAGTMRWGPPASVHP